MQQYSVVGQVSASRTENYAVLSTLGRGTYGVCYKVQHKESGEVCVMKAVSLQGLSAKDVEDTLNEARLMHRLQHDNIIQHIDSWCESQWLFIIMEYAEQGDLGAVVAAGGARVPRIPEEDVLRYISDIAKGLKYLHDNCVLHRDIKPSNIFLVGNKAVIADLGLGRLLSSPSALAYSKVGTPLYFSPELCEEKPYDEKSDVWAFGCLIYELATGKPPFTAANQVALAKKVVHDAPPPLPAQFSAELGNLVHSMLQKNAVHRVSVADILEFPIVKEWVARLANERAVSNSEAAQADAVGRNEIEDILEAEYEQRRALLEKSYQAKLLELEETFQLRIEEAEAATWLARAEEEERHRLELEGAEKQITTLQERNAELQREKDAFLAEVHMLRDGAAQGARVKRQLDEALQQVTAKLVNKEADCFRATEESDTNRKRAEQLQVGLAKVRNEASDTATLLREQLEQREAEVCELRFALEQSRGDVEAKVKMLADYEHLFSMLQDDTQCASTPPYSRRCSEGANQVMTTSGPRPDAIVDTDDGREDTGDQVDAEFDAHNTLSGLSSPTEGSQKNWNMAPSDEVSVDFDQVVSHPLPATVAEQSSVAVTTSPVDEDRREQHPRSAVQAVEGTERQVGTSLLESLLAEADAVDDRCAAGATPAAEYSPPPQEPPTGARSIQLCLKPQTEGNSLHIEPVRDEVVRDTKQTYSASEADALEVDEDRARAVKEDTYSGGGELEDGYLLASPTSSRHSPRESASSSATSSVPRSPTNCDSCASERGDAIPPAQRSASNGSASPVTELNRRQSEGSLENREDCTPFLANSDDGGSEEDLCAAEDRLKESSRSYSGSFQDCSYDDLMVDGKIATPPSGVAAEKPHRLQPCASGVGAGTSGPVVEIAVHCHSARTVSSAQREENGTSELQQRPATPQLGNGVQVSTTVASGQLSPRPMSAALGAIASAKARESECLDDNDSEHTGQQRKTETTPMKGVIRTRSVSLEQLGISPFPSGSSVSPRLHRSITFPILLAWRKQPGAGKARAPEPTPQLRIANTAQQLAWGNKERYALTAGADSSLAILFRPAGARTPPVRKVMARRGCSPEFSRLDIAPIQSLQSEFSWRLVQAVLPHTVPAASRVVRSGNPTGDLVEIIIEFGAPNAVDELLVLRSDSRLREMLSAAGMNDQNAAHSPSPIVEAAPRTNRTESTARSFTAPPSAGPSLPRRGRPSPQTKPQRRPASAMCHPSMSANNKRVPSSLVRRASSPRASVPKDTSMAPPPTFHPDAIDEVASDDHTHTKDWPLTSTQVALLLDRVQRVAKGQESSKYNTDAVLKEPLAPASDEQVQVMAGASRCYDIRVSPGDVTAESLQSSPTCSPKRVGAAEATVELLRHLDYVGQVAAVSQKLIDLVTTPTTSPQKGIARHSPLRTAQSRGRSPLSPTSRGNVVGAASRGTRSFKRQGRIGAPADGLRTSSDALCMEALHLQDRLRAAMNCLGSAQSPRLEVKKSTGSTVPRRGRSPSTSRGKSASKFHRGSGSSTPGISSG